MKNFATEKKEKALTTEYTEYTENTEKKEFLL
jgi:hypothetical protein